MPYSMQVLKRNGSRENVSFDKVLQRVRKASRGLTVAPDALAQQVLSQIYDGVKTSELDELTAQLAAGLSTLHPDYGTLAARISVSNHHKNTPASFAEVVKILSNQIMPATGEPTSLLNAGIVVYAEKYAAEIDAKIDHGRDYLFDYFGFKTLERSYLLKDTSMKVVERPQHMWMRVALALWGSDLTRAFETYDLLSQKFLTHATPTLFNAGTPRQQLSSCFTAGTLVHTLSGVKPIEKVQIDDEVVTHTGCVKKVKQLHTNLLGDRELYNIKLAGTPTITVTGNHRLMSVSAEQLEWGKKPTWNRVDYLRTGDWVALPKKIGGEEYVIDCKDILDGISGDGNNIIYSFEYRDDKVYPSYHYTVKRNNKDVPFIKKTSPFNRFWKCDPKFMELLGIWYGDGSITHERNSNRENYPKNINIVSYNTNEELIEFVTKAFHDCLGVDHVSVSTDTHGMVSMTVNNTMVAHIFKHLFKSGFDGKRIPAFFHRLPYKCIQHFLAGLVSSDGCVNKTYGISIQLTNPPLMQDIFHLARSVGMPVTLTMMHQKDKKATGRMNVPGDIVRGLIKKVYSDNRLSNIGEADWNQIREFDGIIYVRLNSKTHEEVRPAYVYTLGVEDDHSYSVGGIIAENCFLLSMSDDSIAGIYKTLGDCAMISKYAGGIGLHIHNVRARGSLIKGTNGMSNGIVPMLRVFNNTARYVDQGGGKRNGSFAMYLEPWHADVEDFLKMKIPTGSEEERARDLFYALWIPDLFMERVEADGTWTLFCPNEAPGLADVYGEKFKELYERYEAEGRGRKTVSAQKLWFQILDSQMESGTPYLLYKDAANKKSNQKNLGTIKSSNLCTEIIEYSDASETAVCNLASLALPSFVSNGSFDFVKLREVTAVAVRNLNRVIDINFYPTVETERSNMRHRPIGLGCQGLADVFAMLKMPWESEEAARLNQLIFEHMYYAALEESCNLAEAEGPYTTFQGSPASEGRLQPDLWGITPFTEKDGSLDWNKLRERAKKGIRNSLLLAPMPTASTSQILGYNECFEPFTTNLYTRRTLAGEFIVINKHLMRDLMDLGLWSEEMKQQIVARNGSVQGIPVIPSDIQARYKTSWELKQKTLIDMAAARGAFICQSQSLNLFVADPTYAKLTSMHFYAWKQGLKTGCYYLRTKAPVTAQKFTVDPRLLAAVQNNKTESVDDDDDSASYHSEDEVDSITGVSAAEAAAEEAARIQAAERKREERRALAAKLAAEYEAEVAALKAAKERGEEVCEMCSS